MTPSPLSITVRRALFASLLASATLAQLPADLAELAQQVETTHRTADAKPVTAFQADLRIQQSARAAEVARGEIELSVSFLEWQKPDSDRPFPLIRYRQTDSARAVEQGRDRVDYWSFADGKPQDMRSREMATDLDHCRRNLKLARQMVQFLDPATVLRSLTEAAPVADETLQQGRVIKISCRVAAGRLAAFPLRQQGGDDAAVAARIFVAADDHRLVALEVRPLDADGKPRRDAGEFLLFAEHRLLAGRLVPMRITHFAIDEQGVRQEQMHVDIVRLDLGADLTAASFDRPK